MKHSVLTIGKIGMKFTYDVPSLKIKGDSEASGFSVEPCGSALICSLAISKLGGDAIMCAKIGGDFLGAKLKSFLESSNIVPRFLSQSKDVYTSTLTDFGSGASRVNYSGAAMTINESDIENALISYPDVAIIDMNMGAEICRTAFVCAKKSNINVNTIASFSGIEYKADFSYIHGCKVMLLDACSVKAMTGISPQTPDLCVKAFLKIHYEYEPEYIVLRLGERGSMYYDGKHCEFYAGIDSSENFSELANLSFVAGFALDFAKTANIGHACMAANIVSGVTEIKAKKLTDLPTADEINKFIKANEIKI